MARYQRMLAHGNMAAQANLAHRASPLWQRGPARTSLPACPWEAETGRLHLRDIVSIVMYASATGSLALIARFAARTAQRESERGAQLNRTIDSLIDVASGYRQYIRHAEEESMRQERNRIVEEIHDSIGYTLTMVLMLTEMLLDKLARTDAGRDTQVVVTNIHDTAKKGLTDVRISLRILKVKAREEESDLAIIQKLAHTFQSVTKIEVTFVPGNAPMDFPPRMRDTTPSATGARRRSASTSSWKRPRFR